MTSTAGKATYSLVTSSKGFEKGQHVWQIRGDKVDCWKAAGIVTKYDCTNNKDQSWYLNSKEVGTSYYYRGSGSNLNKGENGKVIVKVSSCGGWATGQTITLFLDCEEGKLTFWMDKKKLGTLQIVKNAKYYPAMCFCHCRDANDYFLITS